MREHGCRLICRHVRFRWLKCRPTKKLWFLAQAVRNEYLFPWFSTSGETDVSFKQTNKQKNTAWFRGRRRFSLQLQLQLQLQQSWLLGYVEPTRRRFCWMEKKVVLYMTQIVILYASNAWHRRARVGGGHAPPWSRRQCTTSLTSCNHSSVCKRIVKRWSVTSSIPLRGKRANGLRDSFKEK